MRVAGSLQEYEKHWLDFLAYLERYWEKLSKSGAPGIGNLLNQVGHARKKDPLLQYLSQARNSNEHSIRELLTIIEGALDGGGTSLTGGPGGGTIVHGTVVGGEAPRAVVWRGNLTFRFGADRLEVVAVTSRAQTYPPPKQHLGSAITTKVPHELAAMGLLYYQGKFSSLRSP